jgi:2-iminoacetate synthase
MTPTTPGWLDAREGVAAAASATARDVAAALACAAPGLRELGVLLSPVAEAALEALAARAQALTRRHFGRTMALYAPLYLSNFCSGGCAYCGFAADRRQPRRRLERDDMAAELASLKALEFDDVLLLTGERCPQTDAPYVADAVALAAASLSTVGVETFAMESEEYALLVAAGCTAVTLYQETYDPECYAAMHRWGPKRDYDFRLEAPARALEAGMRFFGLGALLGLANPVEDLLRLYLHAERLRRTYWRSGLMVSFPRICGQRGDFTPAFAVSDRQLAQAICAFRICMPDTPLVLSTRESAAFRDGMADIGITRMSAGSRTTVGGYAEGHQETGGQFDVSDTRDVATFCRMLRARGLDPVFKNWDAAFQPR